MRYININKIISAEIISPYTNSGESWDTGNTRGWQVSFMVGYRDGFPDYILVNKKTKEECIKYIEGFGLNAL